MLKIIPQAPVDMDTMLQLFEVRKSMQVAISMAKSNTLNQEQANLKEITQ